MRTSRSRRSAAGALVGAILLTGGCGSSGGHALTVEDLKADAGTCPVDLAGAAKAAGLTADGTATGQAVEDLAPAVRRIGGAVAECDLTLSTGGRLSVMIIAAAKVSPVPLVLPDLQARAGLSSTDLSQVGSAAEKTEAGDLVALPGDAPAALVILPADGDSNAVARVSGEGGPDRAQVEHVAAALAADLA